MSEQLNYMSGQFCSCSDILSEHLLLLIENPAIKTHHYGSEAELMRLQEVQRYQCCIHDKEHTTLSVQP